MKSRRGGEIIKKKKLAYPGSLYDILGVEKWLERQAAAGLSLEDFGTNGNLAVFQQDTPRRIRYYVEPDYDQYSQEEMEKAYTEQGWKFVCEVRGVFLVYETEDLMVTKPPRWKATEKELRKKWRHLWSNALFWIIGLALLVGQPIVTALRAPTEDIYLLAVMYVAGLTLLLVITELLIGFSMFYDIYIWRKAFRWEEPVEQRPAIAVFRKVRQWVIPILLGLAIVGGFLGILGLTK